MIANASKLAKLPMKWENAFTEAMQRMHPKNLHFTREMMESMMSKSSAQLMSQDPLPETSANPSLELDGSQHADMVMETSVLTTKTALLTTTKWKSTTTKGTTSTRTTTTTTPSDYEKEVATNSTYQHILILGPFDAGNHYFDQLWRRNFGKLLLLPESIKIWPHSLQRGTQPSVQDLVQDVVGNLANVAIFIVMRTPISLIASWVKAPYDLAPCVKRNVKSWNNPCKICVCPDLSRKQQTRACSLSWPPKTPGKAVQKPSKPSPVSTTTKTTSTKTTTWPAVLCEASSFSSTAEIYNAYMRQYQKLKHDTRIGAVEIVPYEDLVRDPEQVLQHLAQLIGVRMKDVTLVDQAAKAHGKASGRNEALERLKMRTWLKNMTIIQRSMVCKGLDRQALTGMQEKVADGPVIPYTHDCDNIDAKELNRSLAEEEEKARKKSGVRKPSTAKKASPTKKASTTQGLPATTKDAD